MLNIFVMVFFITRVDCMYTKNAWPPTGEHLSRFFILINSTEMRNFRLSNQIVGFCPWSAWWEKQIGHYVLPWSMVLQIERKSCNLISTAEAIAKSSLKYTTPGSWIKGGNAIIWTCLLKCEFHFQIVLSVLSLTPVNYAWMKQNSAFCSNIALNVHWYSAFCI